MRVTAPVTRLFLDLLHLARPPHLQLHEPLLALQLHVPLLKLLLLPHLLLQDDLQARDLLLSEWGGEEGEEGERRRNFGE